MAKQTKQRSLDLNINEQVPIRIAIELDIVVRVRQESPSVAKAGFLLEEDALGGSECPDDQFTYEFVSNNASVISLTVEGFQKYGPGAKGDFTTCISDPNKVRIIVLAKDDNIGGTVSMTLKYCEKDVFASPQDLQLGANGFLILITEAKLPL